MQLVSKIETSASFATSAEIIAVSDAVMVARGDLGIDCPIEDVPTSRSRSSGDASRSATR